MQSEQISAYDAEAYAAGMRAALRVDTTAGPSAVLMLVGKDLLAYVESRRLACGRYGENEQYRLEPIIASFCSGFLAIHNRRDEYH